MYNVNTEKIEKVLLHMNTMLDLLDKLTQTGNKITDDMIQLAAMERALHLVIEGIIDTGNELIDGFIMRDPGSYTGIVDILLDEKVLPKQEADVLTKVVEFRRKLVLEYINVPKEEMVQLVTSSLSICRQFAPLVRAFIEKELF